MYKPFYPKNIRKEKEKKNENIEKDNKVENENINNDTKKENKGNDENIEKDNKKEEESINNENIQEEKDEKMVNNIIVEENEMKVIKKENEDKKDKEEEIKGVNKDEFEIINKENKLKEEIDIKEKEQNYEIIQKDNQEIKESKENKDAKSENKKDIENNDDLDNWADMSIDESSDNEEVNNNNIEINEKEEHKENNIINNNPSNSQSEKIDKEEIKKILNEISFNVYHEPKNKLKILLNNNLLNQDFFIDSIYEISIEQLSFQQMYSNLFKDIYHYLSLHKNELKFFRKKLIMKCKENLMNKKICENNRKLINNNITLIGELVNSRIFPKKTGLKCLHYLLNKYNKYSTKNNGEVKYIYLECIIILLNLICSFIYNYQKERTQKEFDEEIIKIINQLKEIIKDEKNNDIPNYTKHLLLTVINKADKKWELPSYEKKKFSSNLEILNKEKEEENINKSFNDSSFIKEEDYDKSFEEEEKKEEINNNKIINDNNIELEEDKNINRFNQYKSDYNYKNKYRYNQDKDKESFNNKDFSKSSNTLSYNKKKDDFINNNYKYNNNYNKYNNSNNNLYNMKYNKGNLDNNNSITKTDSFYNNIESNNNKKKILNNLKLFKRHLDNNKYINNFNWDDIHNLIVYEKIGMNDFIEILIESCSNFNINKQSKYYIDLYIKSIFEYYKDCLEKQDYYDIKESVTKNLENLYNNQNINYYLEEILIILIYYLLDNQIIKMSDFNVFNKDSINLKKSVANILIKIADYNRDSKKFWITELKAT